MIIACICLVACLPGHPGSRYCKQFNQAGLHPWPASETRQQLVFASADDQRLVFRQVQTVRDNGGRQTELRQPHRVGSQNRVSCRVSLNQVWVSDKSGLLMQHEIVRTGAGDRQSQEEHELTLTISIAYEHAAGTSRTFRYYLSPESNFLAARAQSVSLNGTTHHGVLVAESSPAKRFGSDAQYNNQHISFPPIVSTYLLPDAGLVAFGTADGRIYTKMASH